MADNPPSEYQKKIIERILKGDRLKAPRTYSRDGNCIGLGIHRFVSDKTAVKLDTILALRDKGLIITRDVRDRGKYGYTGYSEVIV